MGELDLRDIEMLTELEESSVNNQEKLQVIKSFINYQQMPLTVEFADTYYGVVFNHSVDEFLYELYAFTDKAYAYIYKHGFDKIDWDEFLELIDARSLYDWEEFDSRFADMFEKQEVLV